MSKDKIAEALNFLLPLRLSDFDDNSFTNDKYSIGSNLIINSENNPLHPSEKFEVAIIAVNYQLNSMSEFNSPQLIREQLYRLKRPSSTLRIADLGNLICGKDLNETLFALQEVCALLFHANINVLIIGGSQWLTVGSLQAFKEFETDINIVNIDSKIDLNIDSDGEPDYLNLLLDRSEAYLYNLTNVGFQSYFVEQKQINKLSERYFENYRLGKVREYIEDVEPSLRDAHLVSFDISAIRICDAPAQEDGSPNGLYAEEACRLARYAGISEKVRTFGIYEVNAKYDKQNRTAKLTAQILWYYLEGYINRKHDYPNVETNNFTKYEVQIDEIDFPIVFYKSNISNRWWIEVKKSDNQEDIKSSILVSCSSADYYMACENEISDRWWINFKKLS